MFTGQSQTCVLKFIAWKNLWTSVKSWEYTFPYVAMLVILTR